MNKKSQATIIPILGIIIVLIIIVFIFLSSTNKISTENTGKLSPSTEPINQLVSQCLDDTVKEGLEIWGRQRGNIFEDQGGVSFNYPPGEDITLNYPYAACKTLNPIPNNEVCRVMYGLNTERRLSNAFIPRLKNIDSGVGPSLEEQLKSYVEKKVESCLNFNEFEKQGFEITRNSLNKKAEVVVSNTGVNTKLTLPIDIQSTTSNDRVVIDEFSSSVNIRLRIILHAVEKIIERDITDPNYETTLPLPTHSTDPNIIVSKIFQHPFRRSGDDYIVTINDLHDESSLDGTPYVFQFAVRNRKPRFDHLPDLDFDAADLDFDGKVTTTQAIDKLNEDDPRCSDDDDVPDYVSCSCNLPSPADGTYTPPIDVLCSVRDGNSAHRDTSTITIGVI